MASVDASRVHLAPGLPRAGGSPGADRRRGARPGDRRSSSCRRPASSTRHGPVPPRGRSPRPSGRRRRGGRHQAQHARWLADLDERHRRHDPRGEGAGDRLGRARPAASRPAPARSSRSPRNVALMAPGHEHRRGVAGQRRGRGHRGDARRQGARTTRSPRSRRSPKRAAATSSGRSRPWPSAKSSPAERGGRGRARSTGWPRRSRRSSRSPTGRPSTLPGADRRPSTRPTHPRPRRDEPVPVVHPAAVRPDDRVPAVQHGSAGLLAELYAPNFVTGHPRRAGAPPRVHRAGTLPLNVGGLLLIVFGLVLFGLELTVTSHGLLGFGGLVCFALGASALFTGRWTRSSRRPRRARGHRDQRDHRRASSAPRRRSPRSGAAAWIGRPASSAPRSPSGARARSARRSSPLGSVYAAGEEWTRETADGRPIERGTPVRVTRWGLRSRSGRTRDHRTARSTPSQA